MTNIVEEIANELRVYRESDMTDTAMAQHIVAIPRIHDALAAYEVMARSDGEVERRYHELIYAVSRKYEDEDRHETALRYIREREADAEIAGGAARSSGHEG